MKDQELGTLSYQVCRRWEGFISQDCFASSYLVLLLLCSIKMQNKTFSTPQNATKLVKLVENVISVKRSDQGSVVQTQ